MISMSKLFGEIVEKNPGLNLIKLFFNLSLMMKPNKLKCICTKQDFAAIQGKEHLKCALLHFLLAIIRLGWNILSGANDLA